LSEWEWEQVGVGKVGVDKWESGVGVESGGVSGSGEWWREWE
jgi:hypothetical protein